MKRTLGQRVLDALYKASQEPARRYAFVKDGHHVKAVPVGPWKSKIKRRKQNG